jgi:hypothetical protein
MPVTTELKGIDSHCVKHLVCLMTVVCTVNARGPVKELFGKIVRVELFIAVSERSGKGKKDTNAKKPEHNN